MHSYIKNLNRINISLHCEVVDSNRHIHDFLSIEQSAFPDTMQENLEQLEEYFSEENTLGLVLYSEGRPIGAIKGHHFCEEVTGEKLLENPALKNIIDFTFYLDSIAVTKNARAPHILDFLIHEIAAELKQFDYQYMVAHLRVKGGLSRLCQHRYKGKVLETYDNWMGFDEKFDCLLFEFKDTPTQRYPQQQIYRWMRKAYRFLKK